MKTLVEGSQDEKRLTEQMKGDTSAREWKRVQITRKTSEQQEEQGSEGAVCSGCSLSDKFINPYTKT